MISMLYSGVTRPSPRQNLTMVARTHRRTAGTVSNTTLSLKRANPFCVHLLQMTSGGSVVTPSVRSTGTGMVMGRLAQSSPKWKALMAVISTILKTMLATTPIPVHLAQPLGMNSCLCLREQTLGMHSGTTFVPTSHSNCDPSEIVVRHS